MEDRAAKNIERPTTSSSRNPNDPDLSELQRQAVLRPVSVMVGELESRLETSSSSSTNPRCQMLVKELRKLLKQQEDVSHEPQQDEGNGLVVKTMANTEVAVPSSEVHQYVERSEEPNLPPLSERDCQTLHVVNCNPIFQAANNQWGQMLMEFREGDTMVWKKTSPREVTDSRGNKTVKTRTETVMMANNRIHGDDIITKRKRLPQDPIYQGDRPWTSSRDSGSETSETWQGCGEACREMVSESYG